MNATDFSPFFAQIAGWLFTYAVHSTVALSFVWIVSKAVSSDRPKIHQLLWRGALFGAIVTATLQSVVGVQPIVTTVRIGEPASSEPMLKNEAAPMSPTQFATTSPQPSSFPSDPAPSHVTMLTAILWFVGAALTCVRLYSSRKRLRQLMQGRRPLHGGRFLQKLARRMGIRHPVRLSLSELIPMPFASGILRPEICLPRGLATELDTAPSQALIAHEMAHLAGRDPAWQVLCRMVEGVFFFQPLNRVARHKLEHLAELLADDRAVACTGKRLDLARCLVDVADHLSAHRLPTPMPAVLGRKSKIEERVTRLLASKLENPQQSRCAIALFLGALTVMTFVIPSVSFTNAEAANAHEPFHGRTADAAMPEPAAEPRSAALPATESAPEAALPEEAAGPAAPATPNAHPDLPKPAASAPKPPKAATWTVEHDSVAEQLRECERQLERLSENFDGNFQEELEKIRAELERISVEEHSARSSSRERASERTRLREEHQARARQEDEHIRQMRELEARARREEARDVARLEAESRRMSREHAQELAAQARELARQTSELERQEAEKALQLELEVQRKMEQEAQQRAAEEKERQNNDADG